MEHVGKSSMISRVLCIFPGKMHISSLWDMMVPTIEIASLSQSKNDICINIELLTSLLKTLVGCEEVSTSGKSGFFLLMLEHAYKDLTTLLSTVKSEVTKPDHA
jgi:hypothetical protein